MNEATLPPGQGEQGDTVSPTVTIRHGDAQEVVQVSRINQLFVDVASYNSQFSMPAMLFSIFDHTPMSSPENIEETRRISVYDLSQGHQVLLNTLGLSLEPVSDANAVYASDGERRPSTVRLNVQDRGQFLGFLEALEPELVRDGALGKDLSTLSEGLALQLLTHYDLSQPSDHALELIGSLEGIVASYERLGIAESVAKLKTYLIHAKKHDLREFIAVEQAHLLGGRPATWHIDSGPQYLAKDWDRALQILNAVAANPNAQELYGRLLVHLRDCVDISIDNLLGHSAFSFSDAYKEGLLPVLREVRARLIGIE